MKKPIKSIVLSGQCNHEKKTIYSVKISNFTAFLKIQDSRFKYISQKNRISPKVMIGEMMEMIEHLLSWLQVVITKNDSFA